MSIPYDASRKSLYEPGKADNFFSIKHIPVQIFLENEAALCAEMSRLAYSNDENRLDNYLNLVGFTKVNAINYAKEGTQVFIASKQDGDNTLIVIAFRGTEKDDPSDLFTDAKFLLKPWTDESGNSLGKVHTGFAEALLKDRVLKEIKNYLDSINKPVRILVTGHSLGAALATLTASCMPINHLYTFGSPLVGDADFAQTMQKVKHTRFVDCCDIVTQVPPEAFGYVHVGALGYIDRNGKLLGKVSSLRVLIDRLRAHADYMINYALVNDMVLSRGFADHAPINYVSGVTGLRS